MKIHPHPALPICLLAALALSACDSGNPVIPEPAANNPAAPTGAGQQSYTLTLTMSPAQLEAGSKTPGTLSVSAVSSETSRAPADGTLVSINTNRGNFGQTGAGEVKSASLALVGGSASTSFFADSAVGSATLLAQLGATLTQLEVSFIEPTGLHVTSLSPSGGSAEGGDRVSVFGGGFVEPLTVDLGGVQATVESVENGRIGIRTPPAAAAVPAGGSLAVDVTVNAALDQAKPKSATLKGGFLYGTSANAKTFITQVTPASGGATGGNTVTVKGGGFVTPLQVTFGGKAGLQPNRLSESEVRVEVPAPVAAPAAGTRLAVDVEVRSGLDQEIPQSAVLPGGYTYEGGGVATAFQVTAMSPSEGSFSGQTLVTVTGTGFQAPLAVTLAGVRQEQEAVTSSTTMTFITKALALTSCPAEGRVGQMGLTLTRTDSGAVASAPLTFFYLVPLPRITRVSPTAGTQLGNTLVSIQGSNFTGTDATTARVEFLVGNTVYAGVVQSGGSSTLVRVASPRLPDSAFPEGDCTTAESQAGKRYLQLTAGIRVTNFATGCSDTFVNSFIYTPSNTSCRPIGSGS